MLAVVQSCWVHGVEGQPVRVEVSVAPGLPMFTVVGLPAGPVRESKDRVVAALAQAGHKLEGRRVTVNLAPADMPKSGSGFDLPIAVGLLVALAVVPHSVLDGTAFAGELGLDGSVRPIRGAIALSMGSAAHGMVRLVLPIGNVAEASRVPGIEVLGVDSVRHLIAALKGTRAFPPVAVPASPKPVPTPDLDEVRGQEFAKRALVVAAAGGHNLLMSGPPGAGKTMLARRLPGLLPTLSPSEALEVTRVHSVAGLLDANVAPTMARPFRAPHHNISMGGLVGGGTPPRPGEVSLAHLGVLFLDELPEFRRSVLETLRQPLEAGTVRVSRVRYSVRFPACFQLIAAMNPCPCGLGGEDCVCGEADIHRYRSRLSGPLMDRIDIQVNLRPLPWCDVLSPRNSEGPTTAAARVQVEAARVCQRGRAGGQAGNARLPPSRLMAECRPTAEALEFMRTAAERFQLSARSIHRVLRVARTIADLAGAEAVCADHVAEATQLRTGLSASGSTSRGGRTRRP